ncbi:MAG: glycogen/starch/alpha-glucan phosphorylase, partial [Gemmatimonadetes bacterium]|nr:glycogen/starch/alpha-glucan phosphorylase [Gemmatimonadota bacterium]
MGTLIRNDSLTVESITTTIRRYVRYTLGRELHQLDRHDLFTAAALALRETLIDRMQETEERYQAASAKRLYYLSMEFLIGRSLGNNLINMGLIDPFETALRGLGADIEDVREGEFDAALGNGGLGRLAACFLDSLATLDMPGFGYGINYEYGLFKQLIRDGYQVEKPDHWMSEGSPWQIKRDDEACLIPLFGHLAENDGKQEWVGWNVVIGCPYDMPVVGYGGRTVNWLRLYSARSSQEFDIDIFNSGDYLKAVAQKVRSEKISKVLYPSDSVDQGKRLRLMQEYFFVACAVRDILKRFLATPRDLEKLPDQVALQLNDTHPALAVAELMRVLIDDHGFSHDRASDVTRRTLAYTNHTLLPEALEKWPVSLMEKVVPRHLSIIRDVNDGFLETVRAKWPDDEAKANHMSIIGEGDEGDVRMAHLAIVGTHSVNGVAELHSELIKTDLVPDFYALYPERFSNKTNGITQRRWLLKSNPELAELVTATIGGDWITNLDALRGLETHAEDAGFQEEFTRIKSANKSILARHIKNTTGIEVDHGAIFDVLAKRLHEYKRQLLDVLQIIHEYHEILDGYRPVRPKTYIFAGKAAPGYWEAKQIIKLVTSVSAVVNDHEIAGKYLKVVFIPDYRVSLAEKMFPAADISEQISTAGMEASGTGNMKFALNGAMTIGTLDGANIEIREEVGEENIYIFGLTAAEIEALRNSESYDPGAIAAENPDIERVMNTLRDGTFAPEEPGRFQWIYDKLMSRDDRYFHLADLRSYCDT